MSVQRSDHLHQSGASDYFRPRLYEPTYQGQSIHVLSLENSRYSATVLRARVGEACVLFNGEDDCEYIGVFDQVNTQSCVVSRQSSRVVLDAQDVLAVTLYMGICRPAVFDGVVQRATELGVTHIQPLWTDKAHIRPDRNAHAAQKRLCRWQQIVIAACCQSGRVRLPQIATPVTLSALPSSFDGPVLLLDPRADQGMLAVCKSFKEQRSSRLALAVGPEPGWSSDERQWWQDRGAKMCAMGPRVLRAETAVLAALAGVQMAWGDMG